MENKQTKQIPASEWSGLSTLKQIELVRFYSIVVVTYHGEPQLIVTLYSDSEPVDETADA